MEIVNRGGSTFFIPVADREFSSISDFNKWKQAFRIFSNVYSKSYPNRTTELIQYNHVIFTAAKTFVWDNVFQYDKEFHMHMSNLPNRSWSVILQQAWSIYLKDKIRYTDNNFKSPNHSPNNPGSSGNSGGKNKKDICKRFNRGKCTS